jgi:hypothetical protein
MMTSSRISTVVAILVAGAVLAGCGDPPAPAAAPETSARTSAPPFAVPHALSVEQYEQAPCGGRVDVIQHGLSLHQAGSATNMGSCTWSDGDGKPVAEVTFARESLEPAYTRIARGSGLATASQVHGFPMISLATRNPGAPDFCYAAVAVAPERQVGIGYSAPSGADLCPRLRDVLGEFVTAVSHG